ncbi:septum site determining protein [Nocardioides daphniae]|uniref:Septum site determining protein n=1 Tax=Nocardioides daphniae TaxID=402297 RepID=A0A4P7UG40_9ACTN|nr:septum site determining protein [Nocardioides daphniae]
MRLRERSGEPGVTAPYADVMVVSQDAAVVDEVQRCAAGAGRGVEVLGVVEASARWPSARVVLVGDDVLGAVLAAGPRRRPDVHLLCRGAPTTGHFRAGVSLGAESVTALDGAREWLTGLLQERAAGPPGRVVALLPGSGGAGATTAAAALAQVAARRGLRVVALDCDPWGPGLDRTVGVDERSGLGWREIAASPGRIAAASLAAAVPRHEGIGLVVGASDALAPAVVRDVVEAARLGHDLVVVDLPRGQVALAREVLARCDRALLVVRPSVAGLAAATRQVSELGGGLDVVVRRGGEGAAGVGDEAVRSATGARLVARLPFRRGLDESVDLGLGPVRSRRGGWARAVDRLLDDVLHGDLTGPEVAR